MSLELTYASLARWEEMFEYKAEGFELPPMPTDEESWGIKAHNRPWIAHNGRWDQGQRIIEVGGGYSTLVKWLGQTYDLEPWIADDFGGGKGLWSRWGDPYELPAKHPTVTYQFENFGPGSSYKTGYFDRIVTVSTLEHIPGPERLEVLEDIHRCLAPGGMELHTIDIPCAPLRAVVAQAAAQRVGLWRVVARRLRRHLLGWLRLFERSGVRIKTPIPDALQLLDRRTLVESPDVIFKWIPPNGEPKNYAPPASLLIRIHDQQATL